MQRVEAKGLAHNLRKAGFDAETYIAYTLRDIDRLIEKIVGREFNVGLWGNGTTHILPMAELSFTQWENPYQQFCHFDAKWSPNCAEYQTMPVICPVDIDAAITRAWICACATVCRMCWK